MKTPTFLIAATLLFLGRVSASSANFVDATGQRTHCYLQLHDVHGCSGTTEKAVGVVEYGKYCVGRIVPGDHKGTGESPICGGKVFLNYENWDVRFTDSKGKTWPVPNPRPWFI